MSIVEQAVNRARRRLLIQNAIDRFGQFLLAALGAALLLLLAERLLAVGVSMWVYAGLFAAALVAALIVAMLSLPQRQHIAALVDDRLKLKDRLGTALYAEQLPQDNAFARQVVADANEAASAAKVNQAFPLHLGGAWNAAWPLALVIGLCYWLLPVVDLAGFERQRVEQRLAAEQRNDAVEQITLAETIMTEANSAGGQLTDADPSRLSDELASLTRRDMNDPLMRERAAAQLSDVQERLSVAQQSLEMEVKTVQNALSGIEPGTRGPADQFADALRRGDFKQAQQELQRLAEKFESGDMSDDEKRAMQQQLQQMASQLQQMAQQAARQQQQVQQQMQQYLQQQGLSQQQVQQLAQNGYNPQQVQQALQQQMQQQGMSQQQAQQQSQQAAQQLQQMQQQSQSASQCQGTGQGMSQALQQMANAMQQSQQGQQGQQGQQNQQAGQQPGQSAQQQMQQGNSAAQQMMNQLAQMQNQMQQMQQAQNQMQSAMQNLGKPSSSRRQAGRGEGGNPYGAMTNPSAYNVTREQDIQDGKGRVIASWSEQGEMAAGEASVEFNTAVTSARAEAERAISDDRVPRRYHGSIKDYFNQLPESPEQVRQAPAAPR